MPALPPASHDKQRLTVLPLQNGSCGPLLYKKLISKGVIPLKQRVCVSSGSEGEVFLCLAAARPRFPCWEACAALNAKAPPGLSPCQ